MKVVLELSSDKIPFVSVYDDEGQEFVAVKL